MTVLFVVVVVVVVVVLLHYLFIYSYIHNHEHKLFTVLQYSAVYSAAFRQFIVRHLAK